MQRNKASCSALLHPWRRMDTQLLPQCCSQLFEGSFRCSSTVTITSHPEHIPPTAPTSSHHPSAGSGSAWVESQQPRHSPKASNGVNSRKREKYSKSALPRTAQEIFPSDFEKVLLVVSNKHYFCMKTCTRGDFMQQSQSCLLPCKS